MKKMVTQNESQIRAKRLANVCWCISGAVGELLSPPGTATYLCHVHKILETSDLKNSLIQHSAVYPYNLLG